MHQSLFLMLRDCVPQKHLLLTLSKNPKDSEIVRRWALFMKSNIETTMWPTVPSLSFKPPSMCAEFACQPTAEKPLIAPKPLKVLN